MLDRRTLFSGCLFENLLVNSLLAVIFFELKYNRILLARMALILKKNGDLLKIKPDACNSPDAKKSANLSSYLVVFLHCRRAF